MTGIDWFAPDSEWGQVGSNVHESADGSYLGAEQQESS
jgi:hypothetical protein